MRKQKSTVTLLALALVLAFGAVPVMAAEDTVVAAAITSRRDKTHLPTHVLLEDVPGLAPTSLLLLEQIRTVDHRRLRGYIGQISKEKMKEIDAALAISVGLRSLA